MPARLQRSHKWQLVQRVSCLCTRRIECHLCAASALADVEKTASDGQMKTRYHGQPRSSNRGANRALPPIRSLMDRVRHAMLLGHMAPEERRYSTGNSGTGCDSPFSTSASSSIKYQKIFSCRSRPRGRYARKYRDWRCHRASLPKVVGVGGVVSCRSRPWGFCECSPMIGDAAWAEQERIMYTPSPAFLFSRVSRSHYEGLQSERVPRPSHP